MATRRRHVQLTGRDRQLLAFLAAHRVVVDDQVQALLGVAARTAHSRLARLRDGGYATRQAVFRGQSACHQVTSRGLAAIGSPLHRPGIDLREYVHDVGLGWLWLAAQRGAFGPVKDVMSERELRSRDGLPQLAGMPVEPRLAVCLAGVGRRGHEQLHYPDLVLDTADGRRIAFELELSSKGRARREKILMGCAAAPNLDAVVYLVNHRSVERNIRSSIARLGVGDRVHVDTFAWTPPMQQLAHLLSGDRSLARSPTRQADTRRTAGAARHAASELSP